MDVDRAADAKAPTVDWCNHCNRLVEADAVVVDRSGVRRCPLCRNPLSTALVPHGDGSGPDEEVPRAPWHFKVLLFGTIGYLIYRLIWFIQWIGHRH